MTRCDFCRIHVWKIKKIKYQGKTYDACKDCAGTYSDRESEE